MKAIVIEEFGGPEVLRLTDVETPVPAPEEALVRIYAAGVNRADLLQRAGKYKPPPDAPEHIPGLEFAGVVESIGARVTEWKPGDRVMGLLGGGGYAVYTTIHQRQAMAIPEGMEFAAAAAIPEAYCTAFDALNQLAVCSGETVLIHAIASGVGIAAAQLAMAMGAAVVGTTRSAEKIARLREFGIEHVIDTSKTDWSGNLEEAGGVDAIIDLVGAANWAANVRVLRHRGRMILVGLVGGAKAEVNLGEILMKRLTVVGTMLRGRPLEEKIALTREFARRALPLFDNGGLRPVVHRTFPMADVAMAHTYVEDNKNIGKVVLTM